jgi:uncharacterized membrane protein
VNDEEWALVAPYLTLMTEEAPQRSHALREIFHGVRWLVLNAAALFQHPFDPYPYILLNLMLSGLAALQAPIIMMSQNRQEAKDRLQAEHDYRGNVKAELEMRHLIAKLDQLGSHQWQRLLEIQRLQLELLQERPRPPAGEADGER